MNARIPPALLLPPFVACLLLAIPCSLAAAAGQVSGEGNRLLPEDLVYLGAFRLPGAFEGDWTWSGEALTYYPQGDPDGAADGFTGSLFGTGHNHTQYVSEIGIPRPVISPGKNAADLPTATTLQGFRDIRGDLYDWSGWELDFEIPRAGLAYLPTQGDREAGNLYFTWGVHMQEGHTDPSHGWAELDLADPRSAGPWRIGDYQNYVTSDYLFDIPPAWADAYTPGRLLATGRFRDGGQGSLGPSLIAYAPPSPEEPPPPGTPLPATPLLLYGSVYEENAPAMDGYHHSDAWTGGAWLTAGDRAAVVFVGTKGQGECWYGFEDGTVWPDEPPYPEVPPDGQRGWWSTSFVGRIVFYDPADLEAVARGELAPHEPQPYAALDLDPFLYHIVSERQWDHVGAVAFDRDHGRLFVMEPFGDGDKPLIHVWQVGQ